MTSRKLTLYLGTSILFYTISLASFVFAEPPKGTHGWYRWDMERTKKFHEKKQPTGKYNKYKKNCNDEHPDWPYEVCDAIENKKVFIGMTKTQVRASWGSPKDIHRTGGAWGINEQWVHGDFGPYLYFENDIMRSWQD